jgi:hypothetical protein
LETVGRLTGKPRLTPVCDGLNIEPARRLCLSTSAALATNLLTVRIDLDPIDPRSAPRRDPRRDESKM